MRRLGPVISALLLFACGAGEVTESTAATTTATTASTSTTTTAPTTTSSAEVTSTTMAETTTTGPSTTTTTEASGLPGEPIDFGPAEGDVVAVIGVAHNDVLNLRAAPGVSQPILAGIPPLYDDLIALGKTRELPRSFWIAVDYEGTEGWVSFRYIAYLGATTDETASTIDRLGETPSAGTMAGLGLIVAENFASDEPPSDVVMTAAPTTGDLGEVTFDVVGLGDDAVRGLRLHVFGQASGGDFTLRTVELTALCGRGADEEGACV